MIESGATGPINSLVDYAPGVTSVVDRVAFGLAVRPRLTGDAFRSWLSDLDVMVSKVGRGEISKERAFEILKLMEAFDENLDEEGRRIAAAIARQKTGSSFANVLEMRWNSDRVNAMLVNRITDAYVSALQPTTIAALRDAETYCWSPTVVEAVASAAESLPEESAVSPLALGDLAPHGTSGFWWFEEPIPIKTTGNSGEDEPVVALLWRRETGLTNSSRFVIDNPNEVAAKPSLRPRLWLQAMVLGAFELGGRPIVVPVPSTAWLWVDGVPVSELRGYFRDGYRELYPNDTPNAKLAGFEATVEASLWFSRFFLSATTWLRQRVVTTSRAEGVRQVARGIQRTYGLPSTPKVTVVELRRREVVSRPQSTGEKRNFSHRFVVHGFMRNQWYASSQTHAPKWIDAYVKGDPNLPLRESARVYAARR